MNKANRQRLCALLALALAACGGGSTTQPVSTLVIDGVFDPRPPGEPLQDQQWHLWSQGVAVPDYGTALENTGQGVAVAMLDTSIQIQHPELVGRVSASADFIDGDGDPSPAAQSSSWHGTAVAGTIVAAARGATYQGSGQGGRGVAPLAELIAFRVVPDDDDAQGGSLWSALAQALQRGARVVNNSWTHQDGFKLTDSDADWQEVVAAAMQGTAAPVLVFAAGNDGDAQDATALPLAGAMSTWDSFTSSRHAIAVGGSTESGAAASYSEPGANVLVSAPSNAVVTTDRIGAAGVSVGDYTLDANGGLFHGTSAAAAVTSGVVALMLQANATLGARDVAWILADTAIPISCSDGSCSGWLVAQTAAMGSGQFSHKSGFGRLNASAAVTRAKTFTPLAAEKSCTSGRLYPGQGVQQGLNLPNGNGLSVSSTYAAFVASGCAIERLERVEVWVEVDATSMTLYDRQRIAGDLNIRLTSPSGATSWLSRAHNCRVAAVVDCGRMDGADALGSTHRGYRFTSVRHMGEAMREGAWTLNVEDVIASTAGILNSWEVVLYGH